MRRGRGMLVIAACALVVTCGFATAARADDGGGDGSATAICADLQDGTLDGTYTQDQWDAFMRDPTVQGYCNVIIPPCAYENSPGGSGGTSNSECSQPATTTTTTTTATAPAKSA